MRAHSRRVGRALAFGAFSISLIAAPLLFAESSAAQTAIADPNAAQNLSAHDAALAATRRGDYVAALDLAKKAAAAGQPLEADQVDFISGKAAKQQAALDEEARLKANQQAAALTAQQIMDRQQKDYAERAKRAADRATQCAQQTAVASEFTAAYASAQGNSIGTMGQGRGGGQGGLGNSVVASGSPISNERPGNC